MILLRSTTLFILSILISSTGVFAQTEQGEEISNEQLKQFASVFQEVQVINQKAQQKMLTAIEEKGLDVEGFNEIQKKQQDPNEQADIEEKELEKYKLAMVEIQKIQMKAQQEMQAKLDEEGMTINDYQKVGAQVQNDADLQQKLQAFLQG